MINSSRVIGLILARGGSKGLPKKNIKLINGMPLISWTILEALSSKFIDDLVVSTDCNEIARIAIDYVANVPFTRPAELATDTTSSFEAIVHALNWLASNGKTHDVIVLLEPTSPMRDSSDIDTSLSLLDSDDASSVVSVCKAESLHPSFMYFMGAGGELIPFSGVQPNGLRRQDLESTYFLDGSIYCSYVDVFLENGGFYHENTRGYIVPKWKSLEIDDEDDFIMVEALMKHRKNIP